MTETEKNSNDIPIPGRFFLSIFLLLIMLFTEVQGAEFSANSSISLQEQYDDNIFLTETNRTADYITRLMPSIMLDYNAPLWKWNLSYTLDYRRYYSNPSEDNYAHYLNLQNSTAFINKLFYLDVNDIYTRAPLSLQRYYYTQISLFLNQTDQNTFSVSPHFILRPDSVTTVDVGDAYQNIWYGNSGGIKKNDDSVYMNVKREVSPSFELTAGGLYFAEENNVQNYNKVNLYAGSRYVYLPGSFIFFTVGNSIFDFKQSGSVDEWFWDAGINHQFAMFSAKLETSSQTLEDPSEIAMEVDNYTASITANPGRTPFSTAIFLMEYTDVPTRTLQTRTYGVNGTVSHQLTTALTGSVNVLAQRLEDEQAGSYTNQVFSGLGLVYVLNKKTTLSLNYNFTYSHSPVVLTDGYLDNHVVVGLNVTL